MAFVIDGSILAEHFLNTMHAIEVGTENGKIFLADEMVNAFRNNFAEKKFFLQSNKWKPISKEWKHRKLMTPNCSTGILLEKRILFNAIRGRVMPKNVIVGLNLAKFRGPDKRHCRKQYGYVHNAGLPGSGGPGKSVKRQFIGYIPDNYNGPYSAKIILRKFASKVMLNVPGTRSIT